MMMMMMITATMTTMTMTVMMVIMVMFIFITMIRKIIITIANDSRHHHLYHRMLMPPDFEYD